MRTRKAQSAIEFVVLAGVMFFFFATAIVYVESLLVQFTAANKEQELYAVRDAVIQEIALADRMPAGYTRTFTLPQTVQGISYSIVVETEAAPLKDALVVQTLDAQTMIYLDYDVTGTLQPGTNTIKRTTTTVLN